MDKPLRLSTSTISSARTGASGMPHSRSWEQLVFGGHALPPVMEVANNDCSFMRIPDYYLRTLQTPARAAAC